MELMSGFQLFSSHSIPPPFFSFYLLAVFKSFFPHIFVFDVLYNVMMILLPKRSPQISSSCG